MKRVLGFQFINNCVRFCCLIVFLTFQSSCFCNKEKEWFQDALNRNIGSPINLWLREEFTRDKGLKWSKNMMEKDKSEYVFENQDGGKWGFIVDEKGIIESWHYLGDPDKCKPPRNRWVSP